MESSGQTIFCGQYRSQGRAPNSSQPYENWPRWECSAGYLWNSVRSSTCEIVIKKFSQHSINNKFKNCISSRWTSCSYESDHITSLHENNCAEASFPRARCFSPLHIYFKWLPTQKNRTYKLCQQNKRFEHTQPILNNPAENQSTRDNSP